MLVTGERGEIIVTVQSSDTARSLAQADADVLPDVLATPRLLALVELAASRAMRRLLRPGQTSMGIGVSITHGKPTAVGSQVCAVARFICDEDGLLRFRFEVFDEAGLIADGEHTRTIIDNTALMSGAMRRQLWAEREAV
jgi:fluoroacetyl-CoA thioesterase